MNRSKRYGAVLLFLAGTFFQVHGALSPFHARSTQDKLNADLIEACNNGCIAEIAPLCRAGANKEWRGADGKNLLMRAFDKGHFGTVLCLWRAGVQSTTPDYFERAVADIIITHSASLGQFCDLLVHLGGNSFEGMRRLFALSDDDFHSRVASVGAVRPPAASGASTASLLPSYESLCAAAVPISPLLHPEGYPSLPAMPTLDRDPSGAVSAKPVGTYTLVRSSEPAAAPPLCAAAPGSAVGAGSPSTMGSVAPLTPLQQAAMSGDDRYVYEFYGRYWQGRIAVDVEDVRTSIRLAEAYGHDGLADWLQVIYDLCTGKMTHPEGPRAPVGSDLPTTFTSGDDEDGDDAAKEAVDRAVDYTVKQPRKRKQPDPDVNAPQVLRVPVAPRSKRARHGEDASSDLQQAAADGNIDFILDFYTRFLDGTVALKPADLAHALECAVAAGHYEIVEWLEMLRERVLERSREGVILLHKASGTVMLEPQAPGGAAAAPVAPATCGAGVSPVVLVRVKTHAAVKADARGKAAADARDKFWADVLGFGEEDGGV